MESEEPGHKAVYPPWLDMGVARGRMSRLTTPGLSKTRFHLDVEVMEEKGLERMSSREGGQGRGEQEENSFQYSVLYL